MNIKEAKKQIKNAIIAYSTKDEYGNMLIPVSKQRPVFLVGAPGIGKTAIMEQIAQELDLALVSYSMTHHTRQSALGLPFIVDKKYGDQEYKVSEYTMSEIIASVYDAMEETGKKQGILFLDEINCISETLSPSMLQFLQYKTFGRHQVPQGWIVVTAGNPPEYNNAVKEFDIAIWDRLKKIEVEADFETWKEYAINTHVHPVVTSYLGIKPSHFYSISTTVDGKSFVTARGWDDLSKMIQLYEMNDLEVDYDLISQYLQDEKIAKDFSHYYQLYAKYKADYKVESILAGTSDDTIKDRAKNAKFDERLSLISLVMSQLDETMDKTVEKEQAIKTILADFQEINKVASSLQEYQQQINLKTANYKKEMNEKEKGKALSKEEQGLYYRILAYYDELLQALLSTNTEPKEVIKTYLKSVINGLNEECKNANEALNNTFIFFEEVFGQGQEMLILVTEITLNTAISKYIYNHGCDKYYQYNKQLLFEDKQNELLEKIDAINLLEFDD